MRDASAAVPAAHARETDGSARSRLDALVEHTDDAIIELGAAGTITAWNPGAQRLYGYVAEEALGKPFAMLVPAGRAGEERTALARVLEAGEAVEARETSRLRRDGTLVEVSVTLVPIAGPGAAPAGALEVARDIGERLADAAIRRQWEQIFASSSRGIMIADPDTDLIESVNPAFAAMHGGEAGDFVGTPVEGLLSPAWQAEMQEVLGHLERDGHILLELEHVRRDGSRLPVSGEATTTRDAAGRRLARIAWFEDLSRRHAAEETHREANEMFEAAFADAPNGVAVISVERRFLRVNTALCEMLGRSAEELVGSLTADFGHPDDAAATVQAYSDMNVSHEPVSIHKRYLRPDGTTTWTFCRGITVRDPEGTPLYIVTHFQDTTAQRLAEERQAQDNRRFEVAFNDAPIGMALVGLDGRFIRVNQMLCLQTGYAEERLLELDMPGMLHADDTETESAAGADDLLAGRASRYTTERRWRTAEGHSIWVDLAVSLVRGSDGQPLHFIVQVQDVSERKRLQASLQRLADHDPLTGLWNRRRFEDELARQVARCQRYGERSALLMLDLDGFKEINDAHGHRVGDEMLNAIASALLKRLRSTDSLARLGGDEFAVILAHVSPDQATRLAAALRETVVLAGRLAGGPDSGVRTSIGIALMDETTAGGQEALDLADAAMYADKAARGGR